MTEENSRAKRYGKWRRVVLVVIAVVLILASFYVGFLIGKKSGMGETREIFRDMTDKWSDFSSDKYGFSFKYPSDWQVIESKSTGIIKISSSKVANSLITMRVLGVRSLDSKEASDAIQISIPFDKKDFLNLATSTGNEAREVFYTIPMTLEF